MSDKFTHFDETGRPQMVNVGTKNESERRAVAAGFVAMSTDTVRKVKEQAFAKGDVLAIAELAGIMGAKQTANLIPLCHPLGLDHVSVKLSLDDDKMGIAITAECRITGKTGVEMEALTAVSVAALTIYDMCKSTDKAMRIEAIRLTHKSGGKSGVFEAE
ncbi:MAG: cyclic pyranopterin monophosphate synthase MoaC [Candidatus Puniceispirillaceae bacterium]